MKIISDIWRYLTQEVSDGIDEARREYMTRALLAAMGIVSFVSAVFSTVGLLVGSVPMDTLVGLLTMAVLFALGWLGCERGFWKVSRFIPLLLFLLSAVYGNYVGGMGAPAMLLYVLAITISVMFFGKRVQIAVLIVSVAAFCTMASFHYFNIIEAIRTDDSAFVNRILIACTSIAAIYLLLSFLLSQLEVSLEILRKQSAELTATNEDLEASNEEFEVMNKELLATQDDLRKQQEQLIEIAEMLPGVLYQFYAREDGSMGVYYISRRIAEVFGLPDSTVDFFQTFTSCVDERYREGFIGSINKAVTEKMPWNYEGRFNKPTGETIWFQGMSRPVRRRSELVFNGVMFDITERRRAEEEVRDSERKLRQVIDLVPHFIFAKDIDGKFILANKAIADIYGTTTESLINKSDYDFNPNVQEVKHFIEDDKKVIESGTKLIAFEETITDSKGAKRYLETTKIPFTSSGTIKPALLGVSVDITDRREAETKLQNAYVQLKAAEEQMRAQYISLVESEHSLRESEVKYRRLTETAHDLIISVDLNFKITYVNQSFLNLVGDMNPVGLSLLDFTPPHLHDLQEAVMQKRREGFSDMMTFDWDINLPTGEKAAFDIRGTLITEDEKPVGVLFVARDITERRKAEEELRRLSTAIEQASEDIVITDTEGIIQYVNPAFEKITGYSRGEAIGSKPSILKSGIHEPSFYKEMWKTIKDGRVWTGHIINRRKDGNLIEEDATISPLLTSAGALTGYVALKRDVTDAVRMEKQLRQSQKMESIGTLAGGIAHDFNNILASLMGFAALAKMKTTDEKITSYLSQILQASVRARDLVKQILTFSRQSEQEKKPVMLIPLVKEVGKFVRASLPTTIEIEQKISASSDVVMADATQMHQLIMNLCMNAGHAMREKGGLLEIALDEVRIDKGKNQYAELPQGSYLQLTVRDTGHGIEERIMARIFDPYFTTKAQGEGTGLGLSVVDGIVKGHGGGIKVYSEVGKGTAFHVYLPLFTDNADINDEAGVEIPRGRNESILLVDDEEMLAESNKLVLEEIGYKVVTATDPVKAIEIFRSERDGFDLVITDKTMPRITGFDLAREIKGIRNNIPVIICSGFQDKEDAAKITALGINRFIAKPIELAALARAIRDALDAKSG